jgi:hypothetical protein
MPMIAVIGPGRCTDTLAALAGETGRRVALRRFAPIRGGIMETTAATP